LRKHDATVRAESDGNRRRPSSGDDRSNSACARVSSAEISYQQEAQGWVLRVIVAAVDLPPGGPIDVGLLSEISRDLSTALDVADIVLRPTTWRLVPPGSTARSGTADDFKAAVGQTVKAFLKSPAPDGQRVLRGLLVGADDRGVIVEVDGNPIRADLDNIERAQTIFELPAQPRKGKPKAGKHKKRH